MLAAVERIIEDHLPGGSPGVDAPSMAQAIVRHVRITEPAGETATLAEPSDDPARRSAREDGAIVRVDDFETDDIAAMREQGDLPAFMRLRARPVRAPAAVMALWQRFPGPAGHKPGAWPSGTQRGPGRPELCDRAQCLAMAAPGEGSPCRCPRGSSPRAAALPGGRQPAQPRGYDAVGKISPRRTTRETTGASPAAEAGPDEDPAAREHQAGRRPSQREDGRHQALGTEPT